MRLTDEQIKERKESLLRGKEILQGRNGENMFDNLLDYIDTIEALQHENEQLRAQNGAMRDALTKSNDAFHYFCSDPFVFDKQRFWKLLNEAIAAIDKVIGGEEDV